ALESRIAELGAELRKTLGVHEAAAQQTVALAGTGATGEADDKLRGELVGRLALETPILAAGLAAEQGSAVVPCVPTLGRQRRNTAAHVFSAVTVIQKVSLGTFVELTHVTAPAFVFAALLELVFILVG
ncbi:unnamed protein product, partial [Prorocentrum cordatum]